MATLLTVSNSEGSRRCDAKCYDATGPDCDCCCGGRNHGVGQKKAEQNTQEHALDMIREYEKVTGRPVDKMTVSDSAQGDLFGFRTTSLTP